jgi:hypothetical protein
LWNALTMQAFRVLDFAGWVTGPTYGAEDGSPEEKTQRKKRNAVSEDDGWACTEWGLELQNGNSGLIERDGNKRG